MRKIGRIIGLFVLISYLMSCATLFSGSSDTVSILSEPSSAKVYVNGNYVGNTPVSNVLKRDKDYNILVKKDGYEPGNATLTRSFNAVAILNLINLLCWVVDAVTGAMWKFDQTAVTVTLEKSKATATYTYSPGKVVAGAGMMLTRQNNKFLIYPANEAKTQ